MKLPAVSGSSGRLVIERISDADTPPTYPGQVFAEKERPYPDAMHAFVTASQQRTSAPPPTAPPPPDAQQVARALRQEQAALRAQRRQVRARRRQEDAAWRTLREKRQRAPTAPAPPADTARLDWEGAAAQTAQWRALREQRRRQRAEREQEDAAWRTQRQVLRARLLDRALVTAWVAILVITDNCTRQCVGLPLFTAGAKVTAEMVVAALRSLLPKELQFLISDRGVHFTAQVFAQLAQQADFIHVVIARHRPQSNGIAERFVRTLKEWLADKTWTTDQELAALLEQFRSEYNDRPHQGIAMPGLSPNEFAERIWLL